MIINVIKVLLPTTLAFIIGIALTPRLTSYMYKYKLWKAKARANGITNDEFAKLHNGEQEISTPRLGGVVIWLSVIVTIALMWLVSRLIPSDLSSKLDFYSRSQTLIPLATFLLGAGLGLIDDFIQIRGVGIFSGDNISYRKVKILSITIIGALVGSWLFYKLGMTAVAIPFGETLNLGVLFVPFFIIIMLAVFSGSVIDGMDGLAGGVLAIIFSAYAVIAFGQSQIDIAAFCGVIAGGILAFLWFNIPPARFYMGETGIMALLVVLTVVAFLTDTVLVLPLIALPLAATTASNIIQICSYKFFNKRRVFKIAPLHHHFHALGWSREKVVMRYWVVSIICAILGVIIVFISK